MVPVSPDFRLIDQVAKEIWVCEKQVGDLGVIVSVMWMIWVHCVLGDLGVREVGG
jgi:hypothetical protein